MVSRRRSILYSCNAALLLVGLFTETICLSQAANAVTNSKTHHAPAKRGAVRPAQSQSSSAVAPKAAVPKPAETGTKSNVEDAIMQIRNRVLPIPTINERLIRDIMVGKPTEVVPTTESANPTPDSTATNTVAPPKDSEMVSGEAKNESEKKPETPETAPAKPAEDKGGMKSEPNNISKRETGQPAMTEAAQPVAAQAAQPAVTEATQPVGAEAALPATEIAKQAVTDLAQPATEIAQAAAVEATKPATTETAQPVGLQPDFPQNNDLANLPLHREIGGAEQNTAMPPESVQEEPIDSASVVKPIATTSANPSEPPNKVLETNQASLDANQVAPAKLEEFDAAVVPATVTTVQPPAIAAAGSQVQKTEEFDAAMVPTTLEEFDSAVASPPAADKELATNASKTKILVGAQLPVILSSQIASKTAQRGDAVEGRLKYDLKIGDKLIAKKGSPIYGHIIYCLKPRTNMMSMERWSRNPGSVVVSFEEIVNDKKERIPLLAVPARAIHVIKPGEELVAEFKQEFTGELQSDGGKETTASK